ncbi:MAG: DUF541 domain-containing protein [Dehalococcoidia bacterium]|nr:DUF541 domain-containing protein [Dehalococcoidia bacterium]
MRWTQRSARGLLAVGLVSLTLLAVACTPETQVTVASGGGAATGISVTGRGTVTVTPDIANLHLGVEVTRPTVAEARSGAADAFTSIRDSLTGNGVEERDIQTQGFNIYPQYRYAENEAPQVVGFTVANIVGVKVRDLDTVSEVIDDAVEAGGDLVRINGVSFGVDEPEQYYDEARASAVADAQARAQALADAAGVSLGNVTTVSESSGGGFPPMPFAERASQDSAGGATPIEPGESEIVLMVTLVYEVG